MFRRVAVANRGTIAARLVRAISGMGLESLALCSEADRDNPYVGLATDYRVIGPASPKESYLDHHRVIKAALEAGCDALHPGYGFLAEDAVFAQKCVDSGIAFIGPSPKWLAVMGDKVKARDAMGSMGLPLTPSTGILQGDPASMAEEARSLGFPLLIKPAGGGGGIGMVPVLEEGKLLSSLEAAASQAQRGFGKAELYAERYLPNPRHVEFQVISDGKDAIHLYDRDCSTQRRRQKVVEEARAPGIGEGDLLSMAQKASSILASLGYDSLGTVETLYGAAMGFGFLEVNPRLQVEHAVTEELTGVDLVRTQIRLAMGAKVPELFPEGPPPPKGHAVEARVYAEDPKRFLPSPGPLKVFRPPEGEGIRVETGFQEGGAVTPFYDPMVAQVIDWGEDRPQALERLEKALGSFRVEGIKTNIPFVRALLRHSPFLEGFVHTGMSDELVRDPSYDPPLGP
ncbi:MAG: biotin carboxylase [Deltaproteobacteria bacterium]|jgi:acetyl-CoA carboxylase biotin carboxylase subunit|nr:biotin carboxylase [Deltaproteobacteria bacterium]